MFMLIFSLFLLAGWLKLVCGKSSVEFSGKDLVHADWLDSTIKFKLISRWGIR
jgi:hypothetical protein